MRAGVREGHRDTEGSRGAGAPVRDSLQRARLVVVWTGFSTLPGWLVWLAVANEGQRMEGERAGGEAGR